MIMQRPESPLPPDLQEKRAGKIIGEYIDELGLNLRGLAVYTEAATGYYRYAPLICAMAGAERVFARARNSSWGRAEDIKRETMDIARRWGVDKAVSVELESRPEAVSRCDIVTNSGGVRPINAEFVSWMKETCVVPLMWETWELRPWELDIQACKEKGILVMGTDENTIQFRPFTGMLIWKLLNDCHVEGCGNRIFIISSDVVGRAIRRTMRDNGVEFRWTSFDPEPDPDFLDTHIPSDDRSALLDWLAKADALVCVERRHDREIIGPGGLFTACQLHEVNEAIILINRSGVVDYQGLKKEGVFIYPDRETRHGVPTVGSYYLGPRPVLKLAVAGLKVGEAMARARLAGLGPAEAAAQAMKNSPAQDFKGELAWIW